MELTVNMSGAEFLRVVVHVEAILDDDDDRKDVKTAESRRYKGTAAVAVVAGGEDGA